MGFDKTSGTITLREYNQPSRKHSRVSIRTSSGTHVWVVETPIKLVLFESSSKGQQLAKR